MTATRYWIDTQAATGLDPAVRALHYGDGLFETLCVRDAACEHLDRHLQRLLAGCKALRLEFSDRSGLAAELQQRASELGNGVIKIILSRGPGGRGYRFSEGQGVTRIVSAQEMPDYPRAWPTQGVRARICDLRLGPQPRLAGLKHLNRLEQVMARAEWGDDFEEGLMLDHHGRLIEGTMSNLFVIRDGELCTPRLDACGVAGVMRSVLLDLAAALGLSGRRESLLPADLLSAEEVFLCNSLIGIWPVISVSGQNNFSVGPVTRRLQQALSVHSTGVTGNWYSW